MNIREAVALVDLSGFPIPVRLLVEKDDELTVELDVPLWRGREDAPPSIQNRVGLQVPCPQKMTDGTAVELIYDAVKVCVLHELQEQLVWRGRRVLDPHVAKPEDLKDIALYVDLQEAS